MVLYSNVNSLVGIRCKESNKQKKDMNNQRQQDLVTDIRSKVSEVKTSSQSQTIVSICNDIENKIAMLEVLLSKQDSVINR